MTAQPQSFQTETTLRLARLLASGGDERIRLDPTTGRNRYGVPSEPAENEVWFSSSTASAISPLGWTAAAKQLERIDGHPGAAEAAQEAIRERIAELYGVAGCQVVLTGSGTEAELVLLALALGDGVRPVVNIVTAPNETGRGVLAAASGRHFLEQTNFGGVAAGERLTGWEGHAIETEALEIRDPDGALRDPAAVDVEAEARMAAAAARGCHAILHVLDASKTGRPGVGRPMARTLADRYAGRALVVVDACQLRCSPQTLREDLADGAVVMVTGSKFAGGPTFSGALILPRAVVRRLARSLNLAAALLPYSSAGDWPAALRPRALNGQPANLGLILRWTAALAEIDRFERQKPALAEDFRGLFEDAAGEQLARRPWLTRIDPAAKGERGNLICVQDRTQANLRSLHTVLRGPVGDHRLNTPCHLGQPIAVGGRDALRVCSSMPLISAFAELVAKGAKGEDAFAPVARDLALVFDKWDRLRAESSSR